MQDFVSVQLSTAILTLAITFKGLYYLLIMDNLMITSYEKNKLECLTCIYGIVLHF